MLNHANDSVTFIHNTNDKICWHTSVCSIAYCWWSVVMCFTVCRRDKRAYRHSYIPLTDASKQLNSLKQPLSFVLSYQKRNSRTAILLVFAGRFSAWLWSSYLYIYIFFVCFCPRSFVFPTVSPLTVSGRQFGFLHEAANNQGGEAMDGRHFQTTRYHTSFCRQQHEDDTVKRRHNYLLHRQTAM